MPRPLALALAPLALALALLLAAGASAAMPPPPAAARSAAGRHVVVVGAGFSGLAAACELRLLGYDVTVVDRLAAVGGRAQRTETAGGFVHDAGPSWYWMPEVFDDVLARFGQRRELHYNLTRLDPAYRIVFGGALPHLDVPGSLAGFLDMAARLDPGADVAAFFADGAAKYDVGVRSAIWEVPAWPLAPWMLARGVGPSLLATSLAAHVARFTSSPRLRAVLEWPSQFLGLDAAAAPSLYALLTWSGHAQGTWLPAAADGGMAAPARALHRTAIGLGVRFELGAHAEVTRIVTSADGRRVAAVWLAGGASLDADGVVAAADYRHVEQDLLPQELRRHAPSYWVSRTMTPPVVVFSLCVAAPVTALPLTHTLFLDDTALPFYASSSAFEARLRGSEAPNLTSVFVLVPLRADGPEAAAEAAAVGAAATDDAAARMHVSRAAVLARVLARLGVAPADVRCGDEGYGPPQYAADFHAWRGNAFGLACTLPQTLWGRPPMSSLAYNLVFAGHLTHPGPGVPPALVSGVLAARLMHAQLEDAAAPSASSLLVPICLLLALLAAAVLAHTPSARAALALHRGGRSYFLAAAAFPPAAFARTAALYAVLRAADDVADCTHCAPATRAADLEAFEASVLATRATRLGYSRRLWHTFFAAMRADVAAAAAAETRRQAARGQRPRAAPASHGGPSADENPGGGPFALSGLVCATQGDLVAYMGGSAAVLGELMLPILLGGHAAGEDEDESDGEPGGAGPGGAFASPDAELVASARALGLAFQLTNMLRDVREDARALGRQYVPLDACARCGLEPGTPLAAADPADPRFRRVMENMFSVADAWYAQADAGIARLPAATRAPIALARSVYSRLHGAIRAAGYALEPRVIVPLWRKLADAASLLPPALALRASFAELAAALLGLAAEWAACFAALAAVWLATRLVNAQGDRATPVTYLDFHRLWTLPAVAALVVFVALARARRSRLEPAPYAGPGRRGDVELAAKWALPLCCVATAYTLPWDAGLIGLGVWASPPGRVVAPGLSLPDLALLGLRFGAVPHEEVAFFSLATLVAVLCWLASWPRRWTDVAAADGSAAAVPTSAQRAGTALLLVLTAAGALCAAAGGRLTYLGLLLLWACPVLLLQWAVGGAVLRAHATPLARAVLLAGGGLALADRWAIVRGVWTLSPERALWAWAPGLHPEEVLFFFLASAMCCCGLTLALWAEHGFEPRLHLAGVAIGRGWRTATAACDADETETKKAR